MDIMKSGIDIEMREKLSKMAEEMEFEFERHVIPFWKLMRDKDFGGYYGKIGHDLKLDRGAEKGCILNSRILWAFSNLYLFSKKQEYRIYAKAAYDFLMEHFIDKVWGGLFWSVSHDGDPEETSKHTYNMAFAIYGLASYYDATGDREALVTAYTIFETIEKNCHDEGGYLEAFSRHFDSPAEEKISEKDKKVTYTMNTLLHLMEAYTELYRVDDIDIYNKRRYVREKLLPILEIFKTKMYNPEKKRIESFFDADYNSLYDITNYGHDLQAAWLFDRAVKILEVKRTDYDLSGISRELTENTYNNAFNEHGIPYLCEDGNVDETRAWWTQCEAVTGFLNGFSKSGDLKYLDAAVSVWNYIKNTLVDKRPGSEWYSEADADEIPVLNKPIVSEWKCPYHNIRMYIETIKRLGSYDDKEITEVLTMDGE